MLERYRGVRLIGILHDTGEPSDRLSQSSVRLEPCDARQPTLDFCLTLVDQLA